MKACSTVLFVDGNRESWEAVPGYEGLYEVSNLGQVRSLPRQTPHAGIRGGKLLKQILNNYGYPVVNLYRGGERKMFLVHRLVLEVFAGPCPKGMEGLHGQDGRVDASLPNLQWGTHAKNLGADRQRDGTTGRGERCGLAKLTWDQVCRIRERVANGERQVAVARDYDIDPSNVSYIVNQKSWAYPPEEW